MASVDPWTAVLEIAVGFLAVTTAWGLISARRAREAAAAAQSRATEEHVWAQDLRLRLESAEARPAEGAAGPPSVDLSRLTRAVRDVAGCATRDDLAEALACAAETTAAARDWVVLLAADADARDFVVTVSGGETCAEAWPVGARISSEAGRLGLAVRRRVALTTDDVALDPPVVRRQVERTEAAGLPTEVVVPVVCGDRVVAVVGIAGTVLPLTVARQALEIVARTAAVVLARIAARAPGPDDRDAVTGLANRRWFHATAAADLERLSRDGRQAALVLFGLGDEARGVRRDALSRERLVRGIAQLVRPQVRESDLVARWSEDEIVVLLPDADAGVAHVVASRVHAAADALARAVGESAMPPVALFSGLAATADAGDTLEQVVAAAETRLRQAYGVAGRVPGSGGKDAGASASGVAGEPEPVTA